MKLKKYIFLGIISMALSFSFSTTKLYCDNQNAAQKMSDFKYDKEQEVSLSKDYTRCVFEIKFDEKGDYSAILLNSDKVLVDTFSVVAEDTLSVEVANVKIGNYYIQILNNDGSGELPHTKITVSASTKNTTSVVDNIKVGKDIAGLKIYQKNSAIVAEWKDDTIGDVNIKIVNLDTAETIANTKTNESYYECKLDDTVKNIMITVVPASSAGISGAGQSFNIEVNYDPLATVEYADIDYCNEDYTNVIVTLRDTYKVLITNNDVNIVIQENVSPGTYEFSVPLTEEGVNKIKTYIIDENGNMKSTDVNIIKDTIGPNIIFDSDYSSINVYSSDFVISGSITDYTAITVNDYPVDVATDGTFSYNCTLHLGENDIKVRAVDYAGNEVHYDMKINYEEDNKRTAIPMEALVKMVIYPVLVVGLVIILIRDRKKKAEKAANKTDNIKKGEEQL